MAGVSCDPTFSANPRGTFILTRMPDCDGLQWAAIAYLTVVNNLIFNFLIWGYSSERINHPKLVVKNKYLQASSYSVK